MSYRLFGAETSAYSTKMRSYLKYKAFAFDWVPRTSETEDELKRVSRFGTLPVMAVGLLLNIICVFIALSGIELMHFVSALFLLGVGWNFLFTASTTLSLGTWRPEEKDKAQGALNFCVFAMLALSSLASGVLVTTQGWRLLNMGSLLPLGLTAVALFWLALRKRPIA